MRAARNDRATLHSVREMHIACQDHDITPLLCNACYQFMPTCRIGRPVLKTDAIRNVELKARQSASQPAQRGDSMCPGSHTCQIFGKSDTRWEQYGYRGNEQRNACMLLL